MTMRHRATIYIDCDAMEFGIEPRVREIADFSRQVQTNRAELIAHILCRQWKSQIAELMSLSSRELSMRELAASGVVRSDVSEAELHRTANPIPAV